MGNRTLKAGLFAALAAGALWVLPMSAWAASVFPEGISADGESLAGKTWEDAFQKAHPNELITLMEIEQVWFILVI